MFILKLKLKKILILIVILIFFITINISISQKIFAAEILGVLRTGGEKKIDKIDKNKKGSSGIIFFKNNKDNISISKKNNIVKNFVNAKEYLQSLPEIFKIKKEKILFRDSQKRIYVIENNLKRHIHTINELRKNYQGLEIRDTADNILCKCINRDFKNERLIRGKDEMVYFVYGNIKKRVFNKLELANDYQGMRIYEVDGFILGLFKNI